MKQFVIKQIPLLTARQFVTMHHRHHSAPKWHIFSLGCYTQDETLVGVAIVMRPNSRMLCDGKTLEVTRLCSDGTRNVCSALYSACAREAKRRGYTKIITYILESELGTSLKASGWTLESEHCGGLFWSGKRYRPKQYEQMRFFEEKKPPREYKKRYAKLVTKQGVN